MKVGGGCGRDGVAVWLYFPTRGGITFGVKLARRSFKYHGRIRMERVVVFHVRVRRKGNPGKPHCLRIGLFAA